MGFQGTSFRTEAFCPFIDINSITRESKCKPLA